jgi:hypothetical protein
MVSIMFFPRLVPGLRTIQEASGVLSVRTYAAPILEAAPSWVEAIIFTASFAEECLMGRLTSRDSQTMESTEDSLSFLFVAVSKTSLNS